MTAAVQITLVQGCTFRQTFTVDLSARGIPDVGAWATGTNTVTIDYDQPVTGTPITLNLGYVYFEANQATVTLTKEFTRDLAVNYGRFSVRASNGTDTWQILAGAWRLARTSHKPTGMELAFECPDGIIQDLAAMPDATTNPQDKRLFIAQGRTRASLRISDGLRIPSEEKSFRVTNTKVREKVLSLAIAQTSQLIYTLTLEGGLFCESIAVPSLPVQAATPLDIRGYLEAGEVLLQVAVWDAPGEEIVAVLTERHILLFRKTGSTLAWVSTSDGIGALTPFTDTNPVPANSINTLKCIIHERFVIAKDKDNRVVAYVTVQCTGYELVKKTRPFATVLVLCDLNRAGAYATPLFKQDTGVFTYFVFYNPFPTTPTNWIAFATGGGIDPATGQNYLQKGHYRIFDMVPFDTGATLLLVVAMGRRNQANKLDVSNAFTTGLVPSATIPCHPSFTTDPYLCKEIYRINVHPTNVNRWLVYEENNDGIRVVDPAGPTYTIMADARYNNGAHHNHAVVSIAGSAFTCWSSDSGTVDYVLRCTDGSTTTPVRLFSIGMANNSDGIAFLPPANLFVPTFGGVLHYKRAAENGFWKNEPADFEPSTIEDPLTPGSFLTTNTEWIITGLDARGAGRHSLFVVAASYGPVEFQFLTDGSLGPAIAHVIPLPSNLLPGWPARPEGYYNNTGAYVVIDGTPVLFTEMTWFTGGEFALCAHKRNATTGDWDFFATAIHAPGYPGYTDLANHIHITRDLTNATFAITSSFKRFFITKLSELFTSNHLPITQAESTASRWNSLDQILTLQDRAFFVVQDPAAGGADAQLIMFPFNAAAGTIDTTTALITISNTDLDLPADTTWLRTFAATIRPLDSDNRRAGIYLGLDDGSVLEFLFDRYDSPELRFIGSWRGDYDFPIQAMVFADLGDGEMMIVSNDSQTFSLVKPYLE